MFAERKLFIATKHQKETVITPLLEKNLGVICFTLSDFETDNLGTFSGEIDRKQNAFETLRLKCEQGRQFSNCDLVVASEGSFGSHPSVFFAAADEEMIMIKDFKNDLEIWCRELSLETNFNSQKIENHVQLNDFLNKVGFPDHGIILKSSEKNPLKIIKDCSSKNEMITSYESLRSQFGNAFVETDMRAHKNPMRMKVIEKAVLKLIEKINKKCPQCQTPGFDVSKANPGLICENCLLPTRSILSYLYCCKKCNFQTEEKYPNGKTFENPTYCDICNP